MSDGWPMPERLTRAQSKERTFEALLAAAHGVFVERGYQSATLDAIAAEAGFTKGAVYAHFRSKEDLLCLLFERALRRDALRMERLLDQADDHATVTEQMGNFIDFVDERDGLPDLGLELQIEARNNPGVAGKVIAAISEHERSVARVIERYFEIAGVAPPIPPDQLAPTIINLVVGFALAKKAYRVDGPGSPPIIRAMLGLPLDRPRAAVDPFAGL